MKKVLIIFFALLFLFPLATAIEIDMKTDFSQGETLIAKISGNFYEPISKEDIIFNRGHVRTSIIPFVTEINNNFYIYAQLLDKSPNNYSIIIENAKFIQGNTIIEEDILKNFSITENFADFSVNPGFVLTNEDFFIEIRNLKDNEVNVVSTISDESSSNTGFFASLFGDVNYVNDGPIVTLKPGEIKKINFEISGLEDFGVIRLSSENSEYEIPFNVFSREEEEKEKRFRFEPSEIDVSMATDSETFKIVYLRNLGEETIENISLEVSDSLAPYIGLSIDNIDKLEGNSSKKINVYFYSYEEEVIVKGEIIASSGNDYAYASVFLDSLKDFIPLDDNEEKPTFSSSKTCSELNGNICTSTQKCDGEIEYATDNVCCIGECVEIEESPTGMILGWTILILIILFLIWFYLKRYKKVEGISDLINILKKK